MGLVKAANPVKIDLKHNVQLLNKPQYPLKPEAVKGIRKTIDGLLEAGVLIDTQSPCNTPIFLVLKADKSKYRLVHEGLEISSTLAQYVDDILIADDTLEECRKDSLKVLQRLAEKGHQVSKTKLQYCRSQVEYLGGTISERTIAI